MSLDESLIHVCYKYILCWAYAGLACEFFTVICRLESLHGASSASPAARSSAGNTAGSTVRTKSLQSDVRYQGGGRNFLDPIIIAFVGKIMVTTIIVRIVVKDDIVVPWVVRILFLQHFLLRYCWCFPSRTSYFVVRFFYVQRSDYFCLVENLIWSWFHLEYCMQRQWPKNVLR